jgi:hypothetical protein
MLVTSESVGFQRKLLGFSEASVVKWKAVRWLRPPKNAGLSYTGSDISISNANEI